MTAPFLHPIGYGGGGASSVIDSGTKGFNATATGMQRFTIPHNNGARYEATLLQQIIQLNAVSYTI